LTADSEFFHFWLGKQINMGYPLVRFAGCLI